jgi:NAD kinase
MACSIPVTNHIFALILSGLAAGAVRPLAQHQLYAFALVPICVNSLELQQPLCVRTLSGLAAGAVRPLARHRLYVVVVVPICMHSLDLQQPLCVRTLSGVAAAVRPSLRHKSYEREREIVRRQ